MGIPPIANLELEAAAIFFLGTTQPLEGVSLRVLYLAERASC